MKTYIIMRKQITMALIGISLCLAMSSNTSAQEWYWAHEFEDITGPANAAFTNAEIEVKGMAVLGSDHYFTGRFKGTVEFTDFQGDRATIASLGTNYDAFVARYNSSGNLVWFYRAGSEYGDDQGNDIVAISPGYVLVTGYIGEGDNISANASFTGLDPVSGSAVSTTTTPIYSNGNKKAFVARYSYVGPLAWVNGLDNNVSTCSVESEGTGITANYGTSVNFFVTGYFKGDVIISGNPLSSTGSCQYNTYVINFATSTGAVNQAAQFNAPTGWNKGKDIICSAPAQPNWSTSLYVVGDFYGDMDCPGKPGCAPSVLSNNNQAQNGYIVRLIPGNLNIAWQGPVCTPSYHAEKLYVQSVDYNGNPTTTGDETVVMKSVAVAENPPRPVAVGEWHEASGNAMTADLIIDGTGISTTNSNPYFKDGFIAQYPGTLLYGNWVGSVAGPYDDEVNDVAVNTANNIFFTGNFIWNCDIISAGGGRQKH